MAIFLSRIKKALNLGTKSITQNGTYNASSDGYDGYSSVEVNVAGVTPTPITPSNASPAALTSGSAVSPTANGYAIESYRNISPYNTPQSIYEGEILKVNSRDGKVIDSISSYVPSNTSPSFLSRGVCYRTTTNKDGYAIESYDDVTPSDSSPASVSSGAIIKANGSGYLYSTVQPKVKVGSFTASTSGTTTVNLGFQPKYIATYHGASTSSYGTNVYNEDVRSGYVTYASTSGTQVWSQLPTTNTNRIASITSTGFIMNKVSTNATNVRYFAIG